MMLMYDRSKAVDQILNLENRLIALAAKFDLRLRQSAPCIRPQLKSLPIESLNRILGSLKHLQNAFNVCAEEFKDPWDDREFFSLSMRALRVSYPSDFLGYVADGDLIEAYDINRIQVFRNMRFMETSAYSLTEILSFDWPTLFDRSSMITDKIISYTDEVLWAENRTVPTDIPRHFIKEIRSKENQVCEVQFKVMAPLFSGPDTPFGFLATCRANAIEREISKDNLSFV